MSKISDKEIADAIDSLEYKSKYSDIARDALIVIKAAKEEIVDKNEHIRALRIAKEHEIECHTQSCMEYQDKVIKLREERDDYKRIADGYAQDIQNAHKRWLELQKANTAMLEVLKRIYTIVSEHEEAKYQPIGTVRLIGSIANAAIADIEKGAES